MSDSLPADAPAPRLCHLVKIPTFEGYGFNLHAEKSKPGQFIGKVDGNSPAELAGMLEGDRIVEVNGVNIASENHRQVVERIKAVPDETKLLVVDNATDAWYREHKLVPRSTQKNVIYNRTPTDAPQQQQQQNGHATNQVVENGSVLQKGGSAADTTELPADAPVPRLCHLVKWLDFEGYGFNLHAEKDKSGQFVGKIDSGSPAEHAGLREGDRIVEVNGVNISSETHRQIVERIKLVPNETKLLVLDPESEKWYKAHSIIAKGTQANVLYIKNPELNPATQKEPNVETPVPIEEEVKTQVSQEVESNHDVKEEKQEENSSSEEVTKVEEPRPEPPAYTEATMTVERVAENNFVATHKVQNSMDVADNVPKDEPPPEVEAPEPPKVEAPKVEAPRVEAPKEEPQLPRSGDLNLNMSASEMRQLLAQRKKHDPKKVPMDLKKKYELIEQM